MSIGCGGIGKLKTISLNGGCDCGIGCVVDKFDNCSSNMSIGLRIPLKLKSVNINIATSA